MEGGEGQYWFRRDQGHFGGSTANLTWMQYSELLPHKPAQPSKKQTLSSALLITNAKCKQPPPKHVRKLICPCMIFKMLFSSDHVPWAFVTFQREEGNSAGCIPLTSHHNCQTWDWPIGILYKVEIFGYSSFHSQRLKSYSPFDAELE